MMLPTSSMTLLVKKKIEDNREVSDSALMQPSDHGSVAFIVYLNSMDNIRDGDTPEPVVALVPRSSYLMSIMQLVREAFAPYVTAFGRSLSVWLTYREAPVPWQYPAGAIYDALSFVSRSSSSCSSTATRTFDFFSNPVTLIARVTAASADAPLEIPLTCAGVQQPLPADPAAGVTFASASPSSATSSSSPVVDEFQRRERRETHQQLSRFAVQCVKASLALAYGTTKPYYSIDPESNEVITGALLAPSEEFFKDEKHLQSFHKAVEAVGKQYAAVADVKYAITWFDCRFSNDSWCTPLPLFVRASEVETRAAAEGRAATLRDLLCCIFASRPKLGSISAPSVVIAADAVSTPEQLLEAGHVFLIGGLPLPLAVPLSLIVKRLISYDFRLYIVAGRV